VLRILEITPQPIRMYISVAGCSQVPGHKVFAPIAETFLQTPFQWPAITQSVGTVFHIWNERDPYINSQLSTDFSNQLTGKTIVLQGTNHFNEPSEPELSSKLHDVFRELEIRDHTESLLREQHAEQAKKEELAKSLVPGIGTHDKGK
jgi:predicted alpha/beta hydrolase family esterase